MWWHLSCHTFWWTDVFVWWTDGSEFTVSVCSLDSSCFSQALSTRVVCCFSAVTGSGKILSSFVSLALIFSCTAPAAVTAVASSVDRTPFQKSEPALDVDIIVCHYQSIRSFQLHDQRFSSYSGVVGLCLRILHNQQMIKQMLTTEIQSDQPTVLVMAVYRT